MSIIRNRGLLASVGVATATATTFAGFAPAVVSTAGAVDGTDATNATAATPPADGTYQSCSAYFGYGKENALDLTEFDVAVEGGPGTPPAPTVANGAVDVVLVIETTEGGVLKCIPQEVTKAEWDAVWNDQFLELNMPSFPGAGHYVYPTVAPPATTSGVKPSVITGYGDATKVSFEVVGIPDGYTLVSPPGQKALPQTFIENYFTPFMSGGDPIRPALVAVVTAGPGPAAAEAYVKALTECFSPGGLNPPQSPELTDALEALYDFAYVMPPTVDGDVTCDQLSLASFVASYPAAVQATIKNVQVITLSLPVPETTTIPAAPPAAQPARVTPAFTG